MVLLGFFQVLDSFLCPLDTYLEVAIDTVDQAALVDHQLVHLLVDSGEAVDRCHQLVDLLVPLPLQLLEHLPVVHLILEQLILLFRQLDCRIVTLLLIIFDPIK